MSKRLSDSQIDYATPISKLTWKTSQHGLRPVARFECLPLMFRLKFLSFCVETNAQPVLCHMLLCRFNYSRFCLLKPCVISPVSCNYFRLSISPPSSKQVDTFCHVCWFALSFQLSVSSTKICWNSQFPFIKIVLYCTLKIF